MSLLLLSLPPGPPGNYLWATSHDGQGLAAHGSAAASLLPAAGRGVEVVAVAPATHVSWHRVALPRGIGPGAPRLRATLCGLLEEDLLEDPELLHFALEPGASAGSMAWVAVCQRDWLHAHLNALEAAGRAVTRIVPELPPRQGPLHLYVTGEPQHPLLLASGDGVPGGAQALPLAPGTLALLQAQMQAASGSGQPPAVAQCSADPAVAAQAEHLLGAHLGQQAGRIVIEPPARRLLAASRSRWDLAQMDLARTGAARAARRAGAFWRELAHAPLWRPVRWGLALLLLAQLIGLNLWAWRTERELAQRQQHIRQTLTAAFPQVAVVVNAPVQMGKAVAGLRQATGAPSARDMDALLAALHLALPGQGLPTTIDYSAGELRLGGLSLAADTLADANQRLRPLGYQLRTEGDTAVLAQEKAAP